MVNGEERQFQAIVCPNLVENIGNVMLDRLFADREPFCYFSIGPAGYHQREYLHFPLGQAEFFCWSFYFCGRRIVFLLSQLRLRRVGDSSAGDPV